MKIILREEIVLSKKEQETFDEMEKILVGLQEEPKSPTLADKINHMLNHMYEIYEYITEMEDVE